MQPTMQPSSKARKQVLKQLGKLRLAKSSQTAQVLLNRYTEWKVFEKGCSLTKQGQVPDGLYVLVSGTVEARVDNETVYTFRGVSRFAQRALYSADEPCSCSCVVTSKHAKVAFLSRSYFRECISSKLAKIPFNGGFLQGQVTESETHGREETTVRFWGVRYAVAERFKHAELFHDRLLDPDTGVRATRDALLHGWVCPQPSLVDIYKGSSKTMADPESNTKPVKVLGKPAELLFDKGNTIVSSLGSVQREDCFFLNVYAPKKQLDRVAAKEHPPLLPTMVFIHGGAFVNGEGSSIVYTGDKLAVANEPCVVVTINYRLGVLGFFAPTEKYGVEANVGSVDQICALRWVHHNISAFGGDPSNVTIFGESAGGMSVSCLIGSPLRMYTNPGTGQVVSLFHKVVAQSGATHVAMSEASGLATARAFFAHLKQGLHLPDRDDFPEVDLHRLPMRKVLEAGFATSSDGIRERNALHVRGRAMMFVPTVVTSRHDPLFEGTHPLVAVDQGIASGVQLMVGSNRHEYTLFLVGGISWKPLLLKSGNNLKRFAGLLSEKLVSWLVDDDRFNATDKVEQKSRNLVKAYLQDVVRNGDKDVRHNAEALYERVMTAYVFTIPTIRLAQAQSKHGDTYYYRLDFETRMETLKAMHGIDLFLVFGSYTLPFLKPLMGSGVDTQDVSKSMMYAWTNFAKNGVPHQDWGTFGPENGNAFGFGTSRNRFSKPIVLWDDQTIRNWDSLMELPNRVTQVSSNL